MRMYIPWGFARRPSFSRSICWRGKKGHLPKDACSLGEVLKQDCHLVGSRTMRPYDTSLN